MIFEKNVESGSYSYKNNTLKYDCKQTWTRVSLKVYLNKTKDIMTNNISHRSIECV